MDIEQLLKDRKQGKTTDEGIGPVPVEPRKKSRMVGDVEIPTEGAEMPVRGGGRGRLPNPKPTTREEAMMMKKGGKVSSASKRADGAAIRGKTRGKIV